jgi:hypothetical protein
VSCSEDSRRSCTSIECTDVQSGCCVSSKHIDDTCMTSALVNCVPIHCNLISAQKSHSAARVLNYEDGSRRCGDKWLNR